jgi:excisionase family DNA binding protein
VIVGVVVVLEAVTTEEAARRLGVLGRRVRALIERGDIKATRLGRAHLVDGLSVARLATSRAQSLALAEDQLGHSAE